MERKFTIEEAKEIVKQLNDSDAKDLDYYGETVLKKDDKQLFVCYDEADITGEYGEKYGDVTAYYNVFQFLGSDESGNELYEQIHMPDGCHLVVMTSCCGSYFSGQEWDIKDEPFYLVKEKPVIKTELEVISEE